MNMYWCRVGETMIDESVLDIHVKKMMSASKGRFQRDKHLTRHIPRYASNNISSA